MKVKDFNNSILMKFKDFSHRLVTVLYYKKYYTKRFET